MLRCRSVKEKADSDSRRSKKMFEGKLTCSFDELTTALLSSDTPDSSADSLWADVVLERTPADRWLPSDGDCTFGHDKLIPEMSKRCLVQIRTKFFFNSHLSASFYREANEAVSVLHLLRHLTSSGRHHQEPVQCPRAPSSHLPAEQSDDCR